MKAQRNIIIGIFSILILNSVGLIFLFARTGRDDENIRLRRENSQLRIENKTIEIESKLEVVSAEKTYYKNILYEKDSVFNDVWDSPTDRAIDSLFSTHKPKR